MKILALDGSTEALSVALMDTSAPASNCEHFEVAPQAHARRLLPIAHTLLLDAGWELRDLDGFAFGRGPGAFTGLRIAAGLIQGLAAGMDRPVVPVSTLAAIAARCFSQTSARQARVVQDARMGEVYTADFARAEAGPRLLGTERVVEPQTVTACDTGMTVHGGNGWHIVAAARGGMNPEPVVEYPHAADIARLAAASFAVGGGVFPAGALPVYVRDDVARKARRH